MPKSIASRYNDKFPLYKYETPLPDAPKYEPGDNNMRKLPAVPFMSTPGHTTKIMESAFPITADSHDNPDQRDYKDA